MAWALACFDKAGVSLPEAVKVAQESVLKVESSKGNGTGFRWGSDGLILTAGHVVNDVNEVRISYFDSHTGTHRSTMAKPIKSDNSADVGFIVLPKNVLGPSQVAISQADIPWVDPKKRNINSPDLISAKYRGMNIVTVGMPGEMEWLMVPGKIDNIGLSIDYFDFYSEARAYSAKDVQTIDYKKIPCGRFF